MSDVPPAPSTTPRSAWHHALAWGARALLWLPATVLGALLAGALALGIWAASEGSLAQALRWGLAWQAENAPAAGRITVPMTAAPRKSAHLRHLRYARLAALASRGS